MTETSKTPSVSKIINAISFIGLIDLKLNNEEILQNATDRGNRLHNFIQAKLQKQPLTEIQEQDIPYLKSFGTLLKENPEHKAQLLKCKCEVKFDTSKDKDNTMPYLGRLDFYNEEDNIVYELKTSSTISISHKLQLLAYAKAFNTEKAYIIHITKDKYKIIGLNDLKSEDLKHLEDIWLRFIELYYLSQKRGYASLKKIFTTKLDDVIKRDKIFSYEEN